MTERSPHPRGGPRNAGPWEAAVSPARGRAAASIRRLAELLVRHEVDEPTLDEVAAELDRQASVLDGALDRLHGVDELKSEAYDGTPADGERTHHNPDCIVCGPGNPSGLGLVVHRDGDAVVGEMVVGQLQRGAPGRAHGGVLALAIDDLMGHVLVLCGTPAYTVRLEVDYLAASPVDEPIHFRAWLAGRNGRRLTIRAEAHAGHRLLVRAEGLFITVDHLRTPATP